MFKEVYGEVEKFAKGAMQKFMEQQEESEERREMGIGCFYVLLLFNSDQFRQNDCDLG